MSEDLRSLLDFHYIWEDVIDEFAANTLPLLDKCVEPGPGYRCVVHKNDVKSIRELIKS